MTNRNATITVTLNQDETLAVDARNQGMPIDKIGHGMMIALEGQILDNVARKMGQEITPELRQTLAQPIRNQALSLFGEAPTLEQRNGMGMVIPAKPFGSDEGENDDNR